MQQKLEPFRRDREREEEYLPSINILLSLTEKKVIKVVLLVKEKLEFVFKNPLFIQTLSLELFLSLSLVIFSNLKKTFIEKDYPREVIKGAKCNFYTFRCFIIGILFYENILNDAPIILKHYIQTCAIYIFDNFIIKIYFLEFLWNLV